ncbi:hypothetical protein [Myroides sp. ZB35]|uniref:hypothetical protein n=1 Tax=Myroides sp. ZB35 TaxID=1458492 RepID=UPI0008F51DB2|nr:hypothetical protein [Myroides sp. ZB35]APA92859.1 hypothetical protein BK054_11665 [Myroides sp. ZB35]
MKIKINNISILILLGMILFSFLAVFLFTQPVMIKSFTLSSDETSNIGSTIGGITAPIIGIISSVLLFVTLYKQVESNANQRVKNESDLILLLMNQLDSEISTFYFSYTETKGTVKSDFNYYGLQAFHRFIQSLDTNYSMVSFKYTLGSFYQTKQILLIIRSFRLIEKRIEVAELTTEFKEIYIEKLNTIYDCKLKESLKILENVIVREEKLQDKASSEILDFIKKRNNLSNK